ncbi:hypothetical protein DNI29_22395 [Hymenobacter sediminis]|uniref:hypothetical protein n=1 Tax=Hymenobacter sediminis TaxID=2218621 RepID=UPI000DA6D3A2|nr:hypothetical protein [Hymenobacter sediminis]RPD44149.1 hypothetical protein DNI29_22395 [Hymenobacter sediminis]
MHHELLELRVALQQGLPTALHYLNARTPHRYTGLWRFEGNMLRNVALYDRADPTRQRGEDAPLSATYCALVGRQQAPLAIHDATTDARAQGVPTPVVSYCGVLVQDAQGRPFGTLCHYDLDRCQPRLSDVPLLEAAAALFYEHLHPNA